MTNTNNENGFSAVEIVIVIAVIALLAVGGWVLNNKIQNSKPEKNANSSSQVDDKKDTTKNEQTPSDPSDGGRYLVISEWGVRVPLAEELRSKVAYILGEPVADPDNNTIQAAKLYLKNSDSQGDCAITQTTVGASIESGAQILKVEKDKPFNTQRYRSTLKETVLSDTTSNYHLNYITPTCASTAQTQEVESLQTTLESLEKISE